MNFEEFKEYIVNQRRKQHDKRTPTQDDQTKPTDVGSNQENERVHRTDQG